MLLVSNYWTIVLKNQLCLARKWSIKVTFKLEWFIGSFARKPIGQQRWITGLHRSRSHPNLRYSAKHGSQWPWLWSITCHSGNWYNIEISIGACIRWIWIISHSFWWWFLTARSEVWFIWRLDSLIVSS